jgi:crotonobetainyl-CoA:carnitine CoA-transferase CaiB-like acyl-CoA transferase
MKPLAGVRVLAVEQYGAGPFGSLQLAQLGADIVKIENLREGGDMGRQVRHTREAGIPGESLFFQTFNMGKRSIALDLKSPEGRKILRDLARSADAVYNNLRGDTQDGLGLTYPRLRDANPKIVCVHLTAYGRRGSRRNWPGYDYLVQSEAGYLSVTGEPDSPPTRMGLSIVDQAAGVQAALAVVAGVLSARSSGTGSDLDVSLYSTGLAHLGYLAAWYLNLGHVQGREPRSSHPNLTPSQLIRTKDGWLFLMVNKEKFWALLVDSLGNPPELDNSEYTTFAGRLKHRVTLTKVLDRIFMTRSTSHWVSLLAGKLPISPVLDIGQALDSQFAQELDRIGDVTCDGRKLRMLAPAIEVDGESIPQTAAPKMGSDTADILGQLGYTSEQISTLKERGLIA